MFAKTSKGIYNLNNIHSVSKVKHYKNNIETKDLPFNMCYIVFNNGATPVFLPIEEYRSLVNAMLHRLKILVDLVGEEE